MTVRGNLRSLLGEQRAQALRTASDPLLIRARSYGTADGRATRKMLGAYRNAFRGRRAVIIGNGPSLRRTDLSLLADEVTFGLNRVYLLFEELGVATTFLVSINELVISQVADELAQVPSPKFFRWGSRHLFQGHDEGMAFLQSRRQPGFCRDVRSGVWEGATVTYVAMQLAFHMGFHKVVLVGVDHSFTTAGPAHQTVESTGPDPNHFDPNYFGRGFKWQLPDLETSELAYRMARSAYEADGRSIVDATVGGKLQVFPKSSLAEALI
jgi:hypothetical protein